MRSFRVLAAVGLAVVAQVASTSASARPDITFTNVPEHQIELMEWAMALFDEAGLELPPIDVQGHRSTEACDGREGLHRYEDGRSTIHLCTRRSRRSEELLVVHELAHAWDRQSLAPERRAAFLDERGLTDWRQENLDNWAELGAEHAAEILMWGLMDRPVRVVWLDDNSCDDLLTGYRTLTGADPLHGYTDACEADGRPPSSGRGPT